MFSLFGHGVKERKLVNLDNPTQPSKGGAKKRGGTLEKIKEQGIQDFQNFVTKQIKRHAIVITDDAITDGEENFGGKIYNVVEHIEGKLATSLLVGITVGSLKLTPALQKLALHCTIKDAETKGESLPTELPPNILEGLDVITVNPVTQIPNLYGANVYTIYDVSSDNLMLLSTLQDNKSVQYVNIPIFPGECELVKHIEMGKAVDEAISAFSLEQDKVSQNPTELRSFEVVVTKIPEAASTGATQNPPERTMLKVVVTKISNGANPNPPELKMLVDITKISEAYKKEGKKEDPFLEDLSKKIKEALEIQVKIIFYSKLIKNQKHEIEIKKKEINDLESGDHKRELNAAQEELTKAQAELDEAQANLTKAINQDLERVTAHDKAFETIKQNFFTKFDEPQKYGNVILCKSINDVVQAFETQLKQAANAKGKEEPLHEGGNLSKILGKYIKK